MIESTRLTPDSRSVSVGIAEDAVFTLANKPIRRRILLEIGPAEQIRICLPQTARNTFIHQSGHVGPMLS